MKKSKVNETELKESETDEDELNESEANKTEENHDNVHGGGEVHDDVSSNDTKDENYNYDSALEITFNDEFYEYDDELVEEDEMDNIIDYVHEDDQEGNNKNEKEKWEENKEEFKGSDNESDDLESGCESDDSNGARKNKYPMFK
ncbi:uncharacterized protein LOC127122497 [Lathyrus oleraceus]|uniref:uncharacterized protein LOC127122497 n=1 Tax=Pisum sativum TaxID=3888 RepID=UPI0021D17EBE|nr:uncharacterized protein LOC127122497 [Pisum sativum]